MQSVGLVHADLDSGFSINQNDFIEYCLAFDVHDNLDVLCMKAYLQVDHPFDPRYARPSYPAYWISRPLKDDEFPGSMSFNIKVENDAHGNFQFDYDSFGDDRVMQFLNNVLSSA